MTDLVAEILQAHGGVTRWNEYSRVEATIVSGGKLWGIKGQPQDATPRRMSVTLHRQWASVQPFGAPDQKTDFTADRVAIEKLDGHVVAELRSPRDSFAGHVLETPWNPLQRAYFNGYALWNYLTAPFLMSLPGVSVEEIEPVTDRGETWRGVRVHYPPHFASHSPVEEFYFDSDHLIRRHDYRVDVAGGFAAMHYTDDIVEFDGIKIPTKRRAYRCDSAGRLLPDELMVAIDLSAVRFS
ncbi:hypothetical protein A5784_26970 [Mycobacterium sp. 852013-50091_SCH5140682]|uniref:hypothetical protein n=1 Tax=Mycobacterium sp. 852013-50091_SCH5140682 TaxID=1834109 RepID=UPI0007EBA38C|nr:hypothetical protein [Mycobacterium sp. 852013-50091_SCH5140682]OBC16447.1 hypothetical protein A5784_26970 [Mycobacterium sp. 852013-50091_SCH5140682]